MLSIDLSGTLVQTLEPLTFQLEEMPDDANARSEEMGWGGPIGESLNYVNISGTKVDDLSPLLGLRGLSVLKAKRTSISREQLERFYAERPTCEIRLDGETWRSVDCEDYETTELHTEVEEIEEATDRQ